MHRFTSLAEPPEGSLDKEKMHRFTSLAEPPEGSLDKALLCLVS